MSQENLDAIRRVFAAVQRRDAEGVFCGYVPDVVIREADSLPYGGVYTGLEGAKRHSKGFREAWNPVQQPGDAAVNPQFLDADEYVVVRYNHRAAMGPVSLDMPVVGVYKMRDGKIAESQMFHFDLVKVLSFLNT